MPAYTLTDAPDDFRGDTLKPFTLIPEDTILDAVITGIKEDVKPFNDKETGRPVVKLEWTFATRYEDQDRNVWGETGIAFVEHPDCKLYGWTQEAFGVERLERGFVVDTDDLIGQKVRVVMGVRSYTKKGETEKRQINFVKDIMRAKGSMMSAAPAAQTAAFADDPF